MPPDEFAPVLERLTTVIRRLPAPGDLSLATAATLNTLDRLGPSRLTDLARRETVSQPGMTQLVARLERDGYARRTTDPADGRVVRVHITEAGRDVLRRRRVARARQLDRWFADLDAEDRRRLEAAAPALGRLVALAESAPAPHPEVAPR